jgi:hypothetical protein
MISIAAGKDVAVNVILGIPFIIAMKMNLDFVDNLATCHALDHPPFPMELRRTSNVVPTDVEANIAEPADDVLAQLDRFDRLYSAQIASIPRIQIGSGQSTSALRPSRWLPRDTSTTSIAASSSAAADSVMPADSTATCAPILSNGQNMIHHSEERMVQFM